MKSIPAVEEIKIAAEMLCWFKAQSPWVHDTVTNTLVLSLEALTAKHRLTADYSVCVFIMHKIAS